jgi:tetratricopeptide (TPR) repeat protein
LSYQLFPNLIFILAILGIIILILRRLPEATNPNAQIAEVPVEDRLFEKGLPTIAVSKVKVVLMFWSKKIWHFVLEAKDLKPAATAGYKIKKIFSYSQKRRLEPILNQTFNLTAKPSLQTEQELLEAIKKEPKNFKFYDELGKLYSEQKNFADAKDIYLYLTNHNSSSSDFQAKLGYSYYRLKEYEKAVEYYQKSLKLDSTHPNRYYNLGLSQMALNKYEEAREMFKKALEMEPNNPKYIQALEKINAVVTKV